MKRPMTKTPPGPNSTPLKPKPLDTYRRGMSSRHVALCPDTRVGRAGVCYDREG